MDTKPCDGWVHTLSGQTLCFTGKVLMDGEWIIRKNLGGPLHQREVGQYEPGALSLDLDHLDRGTRAHEATISELIEHLARRQVEVRGHARNASRFEAGWARDDEVFIAEAKNLTGANEDQQIRLGIGQPPGPRSSGH